MSEDLTLFNFSFSGISKLRSHLPKVLYHSFYCDNNKLTSLANSPQMIKGNFYCFNNKLTDLIGGPQWVNNSYDVTKNDLTSLSGSPQKAAVFILSFNPNLIDLTGIWNSTAIKSVFFNFNDSIA